MRASKQAATGLDDLLSAATAAAIAERSVRTIRRAYSSGRLAAYRDGGGRRIRIRRADLRDWLLRERLQPSAPQGSSSPSPRNGATPHGFSDSRTEHLTLLRAARRRSPGAP